MVALRVVMTRLAPLVALGALCAGAAIGRF